MKILKVNVTEDHIKRGKRGSVLYCPIALAIAEQTGKKPSVGSIIRLENGETEWYAASERAIEFMDRFDTGDPAKPVKPTSFSFKQRTNPYTLQEDE